MSTEPKTVERRIRFRTCNRQMPRRRLDIPMDQVNLLNPDFLSKFTSETGKILPRRVTGLSAKMHRKVTREIKRAQGKSLSVELSLQAGVCPVTGQTPALFPPIILFPHAGTERYPVRGGYAQYFH